MILFTLIIVGLLWWYRPNIETADGRIILFYGPNRKSIILW